jgi:NADPH:quinone reductase-like Zn-dependent oxidoreductase
VFDYRRALKPQGRCVIAGFTSLRRLFEHMILAPLTSRRSDKKVGMMGVANPNQEDLLIIRELLETCKVIPVIERRYPLRETAEAIRYLETLHARGKVIITIE